ncbi:bromodomain and WD repeat-containing protein 3 isoform X1 [Trichogramma pretiosum]|uniref:bromodomain and WD repeat-containing protein 3 isoform X1 n=1 Tax=Trichogramma pretiosum TaxID=7493 RepID=UPI0006C99552|nr:bromodomain and WD repeat-containing protein 3 isoform X1 [Trichogramma pretiosum]XP_014221199.1 bromodomain and WD repeat-containing protein 3 isoform X1 [Trichogramma pretiosum]
MEADVRRHNTSLQGELYFLIAKFLSDGPCSEVANVLKRQLEQAKLLPSRIDWLGNHHEQTFEELETKYPHIGTQHLLQLCQRMGPVLEKDVPPIIKGAASMLGAGKQSMLRTKEDMLHSFRNISTYSARFGGKPVLCPSDFSQALNIVKVLQGRENSGPISRREAIPTSIYSKIQKYRHTLGHLSAVYCVLYDRTGKYVITGADDLLVKVWSAIDGRLLATFRGASSEIMDIAVNFDNTLLAAGSLDRILRIWCFQTMSPVAVLSGHSGMITSVNFCPIKCNGDNYLVTTSSDGSIAFWPHHKEGNDRVIFQSKPIQYHEKIRPGQAQMICASFSAGGSFLAAGSADHHVRVYRMITNEGPKRVLEVEAHSDTVDSIQWAHSGLKFISGSKDGTANIWHFEQQTWHNQMLFMTTKLPGGTEADEDTSKKLKVTMVCWDRSDEFVVTAVSDSTLKIWDSKSGNLIRVLRGHLDEIFVLESHPIDPRIILSSGHDGQLFVWDVLINKPLANFQNVIDGQGNGAIFDAKWSPDGTMLAATDSHGHLIMYGFGSMAEKQKLVPKELFFHTDYRPLIRDANNYVLDEQTQTAPHLMPPPFLVDVDGNPYPPAIQRLVPGRENCHGEQLVPNVGVGANGLQEVIDGLPGEMPRSNIEALIEELAHRRRIPGANENQEGINEIEDVDIEGNDDNINENDQEQSVDHAVVPVVSNRLNNGTSRHSENVGVRQSSGNWQHDNTTPWNKPILVKPLKRAILRTQYSQINELAVMEIDNYEKEMQKKAQVTNSLSQNKLQVKGKRRSQVSHGYRTRSTRSNEPVEEEAEDEDDSENEASASSESSNSSNEDGLSSDSPSSDSSDEYSDWIADHGEILEPPKRSKRKRVERRSETPPSDAETKKRNQRPRKKAKPYVGEPTTIPEIYRPSEWLSEVIPRKAPYYPQMGDEIVYFRQGHEKYLEAVRKLKIYEPSSSFEPWKKLDLQAQEYCKVVGIKYEIRPPRLCCLKLAQMDAEGHLTGVSFQIKYHDMPNVLDFLVLRQTFDNALERSWSEGNRFRCMIEDGWWTGQIESVQPYSEDFPASYFLCFTVRWDNGETECMSPWDLEPIDETRLSADVNGAVPILPEELEETLYQPHAEEWPLGDREASCRRILRGLDQVMTLSAAEPFNAPVDLSLYPAYAFEVEYPIDLSTIRARFENRFYRRITSAQFDVRYIASNAEKFNERHSQIVKQARIITDICLRIIKDVNDVDVTAVYHGISSNYHSSSTESDVDVEDINNLPSTSGQVSTRRMVTRRSKKSLFDSKNWKENCKTLLRMLWQSPDSQPFKEPVDEMDHPTYSHIIETPMDLNQIQEDLRGDNYETLNDFVKDVRLVISNSRRFNTNQRSKIYAMTVRLSAMFEEHLKTIMNMYNSEQRRKKKTKTRSNNTRKKSTPAKQLSNGAGPTRKPIVSSDDEDVEDDEMQVNEVDDFSAPGPSCSTRNNTLRSRTRRAERKIMSSDDDDVEVEKEEKNDSQSSNVSTSEQSDDSKPRRQTRSRKKKHDLNTYDDDHSSDEDFEPTPRGKQTRNIPIKNCRKTRPNRTATNGRKYLHNDDEDDDLDDADVKEPQKQQIKRNGIKDKDNDNEDSEDSEDDDNEDSDDDDDGEESQDSVKTIPKINTRLRRTPQKRPILESSEDDDDHIGNVVECNMTGTVEHDVYTNNESLTGFDQKNEQEESDDHNHDNINGTAEQQSDTDYDDEDDSMENHQSYSNSLDSQSIKFPTQKTYRTLDAGSIGPRKSSRQRTGGIKRARYKEETSDENDDDDDDDDDEDDYDKMNRGLRKTIKRSKRTNKSYCEDEMSDEENQQRSTLGVSVSSRGRIRKMTPKAMQAFR